MRRFSQRNQLVTLSDINITPLMDLAFVLLIIFVISAPLLEQGLDIQLPRGGNPDQPLDPEDIRTVEIDPNGRFFVDGQFLPPAEVERLLVQEYRRNPALTIYVRADAATPYIYVFALTDMCTSHGITRISFRSDPFEQR